MSAPIFDQQEALSYCDRDPELLRELIASFRSNWRAFVIDLQAGITAQDAARVERWAHRLKGRAATIGAQAVAQAALRLEEIALQGDLGPAPAALTALLAALEDTEVVFARLYPPTA